MKPPHSSQFLLSPESWLGRWLDSEGQSLVVLPKEALSHECQAQKGETVPEELRTSLERVVLFNCDSKDKVLSMFRRLCLEDADSSLRRYVILDTHDFWARYHDMIEDECA